MSNVIPLSASETRETPCSYVHTRRPSLPASLRSAAWRRVRLTVELLGWFGIVAAAAVIAT